MRGFAAAIPICVAVAVPMGYAHAWNICRVVCGSYIDAWCMITPFTKECNSHFPRSRKSVWILTKIILKNTNILMQN